MNPWIAKGLVLAGTVVLMAIRAPHGQRGRSVKVATSYKTPLETGILVLAWVGFFLPLIWVASPAFSFAEYTLGTGTLVAGVLGDRPLALLPVARWPWHKLVDHPGGTRAASTDHTGCLSPYSPSDVLGASPVFHRPIARYPELGRRAVELDRIRHPLRASRPGGGADDA